MKILWLSHVVPYPPKGGVFQRSYNLIREAGRENSVHLVSLNQAKLLKNQGEIDEAVSVLKESCERVDVFPIPSDRSKLHWATMTTLSYFNCAPYDVNWLKNVEMAAYLKKLAVKGRFDVVHVDTCGLFPYAEYFRDVPLVLTHHNIESHMMSRRHDMETNLLKKTYFRREAGKIRDYEREICRKCDMNLVVSDLDAARLRESVGGDVSVTVIPNGVDVDYFRPADYDFKRQEGLIFAGGLNLYTNREAMLFFVREVWPLLV
jgi:glycosyltransferase involved in cell wall biosynthesis